MAKLGEIQHALLLQPQRLATDHLLLEVLQIHKKKEGTQFAASDITASVLRSCFPDLTSEARKIMLQFSKDVVEDAAKQIKKRHALQKAGVALEPYLKSALLRSIHESFERLKPYVSLIKWYHKIQTEQGHYRISPFVFSRHRPQLVFDVIRLNEGLGIQTSVAVNGAVFDLTQFNRYLFLLESRNEYFLMTYRDHQTLEWLQQANPGQYSHQPALLAQHILSRLEENYTVNRNGLFSQNVIEVLPQNRVMLSEISGSFLVLTPQFVYEGFLIEGDWQETYETVKNAVSYVVKRNRAAELEFTSSLEELHPNFKRQVNGYYYLSFADAQKKQWFLKVYHQLLERNVQVVGMDLLRHFRYSPHPPKTIIEIASQQNNLLHIRFELFFGNEQVPLNELQKMLLAGQRAILLKDGSLGVLGDDWLQQYSSIIKHGKIVNRFLQVPQWMAIRQQESGNAFDEILKPVLKQDWWQRWQRWQSNEENIFELPDTLKAMLRPYQRKGFEWMALLSEAGAGACLADDMGLGKTLQAISLMAYQTAQRPEVKHLVICPASLLYNWVQELQQFAPSLKVLVFHGAQLDIDLIANGDYQVIVTTYGTLRSFAEQFSNIWFHSIVIDESHNIKNPSALITRAVSNLQAVTRIALSGTPVINNTFDLYAQLSFLLPGMFGSREFFKREYADAIDRDADPEKIRALQKLTAPFILRRTKEQVAADLPDKTESILWCKMGNDQQAAYDSIKEKVRSNVFLDIKEKGLNSGKLSVINGLLKLRQLCNSCELVKDEDLFTYDSVKTDVLIDELQSLLPTHKVLVFSQFTSMLDLLEKSLQKSKIQYLRLDGSIPVADRQPLVNRFQADDSVEKVFLISLKAGNAGLNLTAADYVFLFDPWWNTAVQQQAIDRTHRIGQTKKVFAYKMICEDSIEEKILKLQERKKKLSAELIGEEDGFVKALSEEDIEFLFS